MTKDQILEIIKEIARTAVKYDTGEREYKMNDWEYVMKKCQKVLKSEVSK